MEPLPDMQVYADLDSSTFHCPCGAQFVNSMSSFGLDDWLAVHKPHTSGKGVQTVTADGMRAYGSPQPAHTFEL